MRNEQSCEDVSSAYGVALRMLSNAGGKAHDTLLLCVHHWMKDSINAVKDDSR